MTYVRDSFNILKDYVNLSLIETRVGYYLLQQLENMWDRVLYIALNIIFNILIYMINIEIFG